MSNEDLRASAGAVLARLVGDPAGGARLREDQWRVIEALVADRRRALVVQRTGWGKSAVYFVATALLRAAGNGPTVIVSPLLDLMRNQVGAAGEVGILLVSPEGLTSPHSRSAPHCARTAARLRVQVCQPRKPPDSAGQFSQPPGVVHGCGPGD